jgi:hypothetical protein
MKERADHSGVGLLVEGSVFGLVLGAWLWGVVTLGAHATAVQTTSPPTAESTPLYEDACYAPKTPANESVVCPERFRPPLGTSREPGADLAERLPGHGS